MDLQTLISFIFVFGMLVFAHELGHFVVARLHGITVYEFALGFGPAMFQVKPKETVYSLRWIPLGGYVRMMGEEDASDDPNSFSMKKPWQRFTVLIAGPLMNFVLAIVLFTIVFLQMGVTTTTIDKVMPGFPAEKAGLQAGDRVTSIQGHSIDSWNTLTGEVAQTKGQPFKITVDRNGKPLTLSMTTQKSEDGRMIMGIQPRLTHSPGQALEQGVQTTGQIALGIVDFFKQLFTGKTQGADLVGPVGIYNIVGQASKTGIAQLLGVAAVISVNLGIFNLLPIPALDGGWLIFILYEMIFRKPFNRENQAKLQYAGFMLLIALMLFTIMKDLKLFG